MCPKSINKISIFFPVLRVFLSTCLITAQFPVGSPSYRQQQQLGKDALLKQLSSHSDLFEEKKDLDNQKYRTSYPDPEDFVISLLVNPCGVNKSIGEQERSTPLGYDCCMNVFGRGEYGILKYTESNQKVPLSTTEAIQRRLLAGPEEVLHNMIIVDEYGQEIPYHESRRADDHTTIDVTCEGFRYPLNDCVDRRLRAIPSPFSPPCWDHNQTVDATLGCYTPSGKYNNSCMQVGYAQNAFIHICEQDFTNDDSCGTFIEIHRENGSPYDSEDVTLAETKIRTSVVNGMSTTIIPLTYKHSRKKLCNYKETKIRIGSMVRITNDSPSCCCPPSYNSITKVGSFFCPKQRKTKNGPFAGKMDTLVKRLEMDEDQKLYPYCPVLRENEDVLMCSRRIEAWPSFLGELGSFFTFPCSDKDLEGNNEKPCELSGSFKVCKGMPNNNCFGNDSIHTFANAIGKVVTIENDPLNPSKLFSLLHGITFNDGRTVYEFPRHHLELVNPGSNFELWFVQRNRFEKILQKKKGFRVSQPQCTFDSINDQYFPFALFSEEGNFIEVFDKYNN